MLSFTVRMRFLLSDLAQVREVLAELATASRKEPGCVSYVPHFIEAEPTTVLIYEQYRDEAAVECHRDSEHFRQYAAGSLYQLMLDRQVEDLLAIV